MDLQLFYKINGLAGNYEWLDKFAVFFAEQAIIILFVLVILLWFMDWGIERKKNQYAVILALESVLLARGVITTLFRELWPRVRPFVENNVNLLIDQNPLTPGFPGAHTVIAFALSIPVFIYNKRAGFWLLVISALIGISRVYVGVHYPGDIVGGFLVALFVVLILNFFRGIFVAPVVKLLRRGR